MQNLLTESNLILISQIQDLENRVSSLKSSKPSYQPPSSSLKLSPDNQDHESFLSIINHIDFQKWYVFVEDFKLHSITLLNSSIDRN